MATANDLKNGVNFLFKGKPYKVVKYTHQKLGRGGANIKLQIRNLENGELLEQTYKSTAAFDEITTRKRKLQYLYSDKQTVFFMDPSNFEQVEVPVSVVSDAMPYVKEGEEVDVLFWEDRALSVEIPPKVVMEVVETDPGVKGNSATNIYKPAKLSNGLWVKVPLFIKIGEKIRVDTRTGSYVERAEK
jgi:elongation factor P